MDVSFGYLLLLKAWHDSTTQTATLSLRFSAAMCASKATENVLILTAFNPLRSERKLIAAPLPRCTSWFMCVVLLYLTSVRMFVHLSVLAWPVVKGCQPFLNGSTLQLSMFGGYSSIDRYLITGNSTFTCTRDTVFQGNRCDRNTERKDQNSTIMVFAHRYIKQHNIALINERTCTHTHRVHGGPSATVVRSIEEAGSQSFYCTIWSHTTVCAGTAHVHVGASVKRQCVHVLQPPWYYGTTY